MFIETFPQTVIMLIFIVAGIGGGILRMIFAGIFNSLKAIKPLTYLIDAVFVFVLGLMFLYLMVKVNFGVFRLYLVISFAFGLVFEFYLLENPIRKAMLFVYTKIKSKREKSNARKKSTTKTQNNC